MKIFMNNKVYVNQKDISLLFQIKSYIPAEIYENIAILANGNKLYEFKKINENEFMEFEEEETKRFFRNQHFIVNYGHYKNIDTFDLQYELENTIYDKEDLIDKTKYLINIEELNKFKIDILKISNRIEGLKDILRLKYNISDIKLPNRIYKDKDEEYKIFLKKMMQPVFKKKDYL